MLLLGSSVPKVSTFSRSRSLLVHYQNHNICLLEMSVHLGIFLSIPGAILFAILYALVIALYLPGVWASMLAGALYGTWRGSLIVFIGASFGAEAAFLAGRTWLRSWSMRRLEAFPKLRCSKRSAVRG